MPPESLSIAPALTPDDLATVRALFEEYQAQVGVDLCFRGFAAELASLPGAYAAPRGRLLLARDGATALGCVALRDRGEGRAEVKRLYVRPAARGLGLGRTLITRIIDEARAIGYGELVLDTLPSMTEAQRLYEAFGFRDIAPYTANPVVGARYMGMRLVEG